MRSEEQLTKEFIDELNKWCEQDLGYSFKPEEFRKILEEISEQRKRNFIQTRIAHLKGGDWFNLVNLILKDDGKKVKASKKV